MSPPQEHLANSGWGAELAIGGPQRADSGPSSRTAFIKQEALEKAREIKVKADEEFVIEKVRSRRHSVHGRCSGAERGDRPSS